MQRKLINAMKNQSDSNLSKVTHLESQSIFKTKAIKSMQESIA